MASPTLKQEIAAAFADTGHKALPPAILAQIAALSQTLHLKPSQLATAWEAHSLTKGVDELDDATFSGYRAALAKDHGAKNVAVMSNTGLGKRKPAPGAGVTPSPANKRATAATPAAAKAAAPTSRDGLSAVDSLTTPSGKSAVTPAKGAAGSGSAGGNAMVITPPNRAAPKTPKYAERNNKGQLVTSYNPNNLPTAGEVLASKSDEERARRAKHRGCTISPHPAAPHPARSVRHMFAPLEKRSAALEERLTTMSEAICETYKIKTEDDEMIEAMEGLKSERGEHATWVPVGLPKQNKVLCVGRICNEAHEGRLNRASIRLEGSRQHSAGSRIQIDLKEVAAAADRSYSFFPGQIVAVEGINSSGRTMQASGLLEGAAPAKEALSAGERLDYQYGSKHQDGAPLSIVSLCGPFTTKDNLDYDPLLDAISKIAEDTPDVVVMCGPFVDGRHPMIAGGEPTVKDEEGNERKVSYEYLFASKVSALIEDLYTMDPEVKTQFVLVPSVDDAFLDAVYPQPPMEDKVPGVKVPRDVKGEFGDLGLGFIELAGREGEKLAGNGSTKRVHCVSNPCTLRINDVTLGVTSTDVLFHISSDECNANLPPGTRLSRIAQHLVQQRSYYPLFPAAKGASLDLSRMKEWEMPVQPDILIVPSKLNSFARKVLGTTVVVNPGELTKNTTGGTYATIDVHPAKKEELEEGMKKEANGEVMQAQGVQDRVRVDIRRI